MNIIKKIVNILFVCLAVGMISIPLAGMAVAPTQTTTENRVLAEFPGLREDGRFNRDFLADLGTYFTDHYAGKNELVAADSQLQSEVFRVSTVDTILVGENDWLYYTDSLEDYLGENVVTARGAFNIAHNIALMQEKVEKSGAEFIFTVAPNKNSLYDENMPSWYQTKASETSNIDLVTEQLELQEVPYADLFEAFRSQDEILYCSQDSHWNQKGAVLAYETIRKALGKKYTDYNEKADVVHTKLEAGDLAKALYSVNAEVEWNYRYEYNSKVSFEGDAESWEDQWIQTSRKKGKGSLLMFRDSFGITLAPFIAEDYGKGAFSRETVYLLDQHLEETDPDTVIVEIVERNLNRFGVFEEDKPTSSGPAIMTGIVRDIDVTQAADQTGAAGITVADCFQIPTYLMISGQVKEACLDTENRIYVRVTDGEKSTTYEAFTTSRPGSEAETWEDNGYLLYLDSGELMADEIQIDVLVESGNGTFTLVGSDKCSVEEVLGYE